jgi:hypothetical protein
MRVVIFILVVGVLFVGGCRQKTNEQATVEINSAESLTVDTLSTVIRNDSIHEGEDAISGELESADRENDTVVSKEVSEAESLAAKYDWKRVWKGVTCKEYTTDDEYTKHRDCFFPSAKLKQVFDIVKISDVNIRTELPETNLNDTCNYQKGCIEVDFQYKSKKHLFIKIRYDGGESEIEIIEKDGGTIAKEVWGID